MANQTVDNRRIAMRPRTRQLALALVARHPRLLAVDAAYEGLLKGAQQARLYPVLRASIEYDYRERLPEIEAPTLIVWGENDSILSVMRTSTRPIPNTKKLVMRDTGYAPNSSAPTRSTTSCLEFLDGKVGSDSPARPRRAQQSKAASGRGRTRARPR